ncbi:hypothetical protein AYO44_07060 [Planctomycetaceae bacterium SCGC AG-212-F19]|nr:hypothetical protein AYO44_07060 [Planctomycetaceae bacterium SCGC AG-212-F19]
MVEGRVASVRDFVDPANNGEYTLVTLEYGEPPAEICCDFSGFNHPAAAKLKKVARLPLWAHAKERLKAS